MTILSGLFVSIRISITRAIGRKRHVFLVEFGLSTIRRIVFIISSQSLQPKEETIIKIAFDHNKIIELNFRLICKLQQNRCQSSKIQQFYKAFCNRSLLMSMLFLFWTYFSIFFLFCVCGFILNAACDSFVLLFLALYKFVCDCWCFDFKRLTIYLSVLIAYIVGTKRANNAAKHHTNYFCEFGWLWLANNK